MAEIIVSSSSTSSSSTIVALGIATMVSLSIVRRVIQRRSSPLIRSKLSCKCGKIEGEVKAIKYDSVVLNCYCQDCRDYGSFIAGLDGKHKASCFHGSFGESRILQVCKSDLTIHTGQEHLKLARKAPNTGMSRFYADCCNVPILNTHDFLGFVGILRANLDSEQERFGHPVRCFQEEALAVRKKHDQEPNLFIPSLLWKLLRYHPWRKAGVPFNYQQDPVFWGNKKQE